MKLVKKSIFVIICLAFICMESYAGTITAEVDRSRTDVEEPIWLTLNIEGSLEGDVIVPNSEDFEFVRTGESTNISIVNGSVSKLREFTYQARALKTGKLTIPSFGAKIDGKTVNTEPILVEVGGTATNKNNSSAGSNEDSKKFIFVERDVPKTTMFEGEAMISVVRLLTRAQITGATPIRDSAPSWRLIPIDGQVNKDITRQGQRWSAIEMREGLIPLVSGKVKVPSFGINASWIQPTSKKRQHSPSSVFDLFQQGVFNMGQEVSRKLLSDPIEIIVKPLPTPKPREFADIVGAFTMKASVSKRDLAVGDTSTVTVDVRGQGALDRMRDLKISVQKTKVYADKADLKEKIEPGAGLISTRSQKFAVVPSEVGVVKLGVISIKSFNPFTETYEDLSVDLGNLSVSASTGSDVEKSLGQKNLVQDDKRDPAVETPRQSALSNNESSYSTPLQLDGQAVLLTKDTKKSWWLTPWVLAIEILIFSIITGFFLMRRTWAEPKEQKKLEMGVPRDSWRLLEKQMANPNEQTLLDVFEQLKYELALPGQDPKAMTTQDLLRNATEQKIETKYFETMRRVLGEVDRRRYGAGDGIDLSKSLIEDIRSLLEFWKNRGHR